MSNRLMNVVGMGIVSLAVNAAAHAQCTPSWHLPGSGVTAPASTQVRCQLVYNGNLLVGGFFNNAGGNAINNIAQWDGTTWSAFGGTGANGFVGAMVIMPNNDLVIGGNFTSANGTPATRIARWNGTAWSALGTGMDGTVLCLAVLNNGDLVAGGTFTNAGGNTVNSIARWNGSVWSDMAGGMVGDAFGRRVNCLAIDPTNGDLIAGGEFVSAGGTAATYIAKWNGTAWSALGSGMNNEVYAMVMYPNGVFEAAGAFSNPANRLARWGGGAWSAFPSTTNNTITSLALDPNGDLIVGGTFTTAGVTPASKIARFNFANSTWSAYGSGIGGALGTFVYTLGMFQGDVYAGGDFATAGGAAANKIASWGCVDIIGDTDGDGHVNIDDLVAVITNWGSCDRPCPAYCPADVNHDCLVNIDDLVAVITHWG